MLVAEASDACRFITQPEHGTQVGRFADRWGNETFAQPAPSAPVTMAAALHDAGWYDSDEEGLVRAYYDGPVESATFRFVD